MARRVLSLWLPRLATDRHRRRPGEKTARPLAMVATGRGVVRVAAVDRPAEAAGVRPGLTLADARAIAPDLEAVDLDPVGDARALDRLADWCGRYTPWTAPDLPDGVWLDITGCAHLFGGEAVVLTDLAARLSRQGLETGAAIADTPGAAWAAARFGGPALVPANGQRDALAGLPLAALRLPAATVEGLARLGLRRVGDLYPMPRAGLAARWGTEVATRLDQALGHRAEPISPRRPIVPDEARLAFAEPIVTPKDRAAATRHLLERLCAGLEADGRGARQLELAGFRVDGRVERVGIGTSRPTRDPLHLFRLLNEKLDRLDPGLGFEVMVLSALATDPLPAIQTGFPLQTGLQGPQALGTDPLAPLADRLGNRLGLDNVLRLLPRESWWPEWAVETAPALTGSSTEPWPEDRPRPVRLLPHPEPIDVIAPVPDDPPILFRWRDIAHRVSRADGPERLEPEWWRGLSELRDYYRVEDGDGSRYWVYRAGLYQPGHPARWFLHGFFG